MNKNINELSIQETQRELTHANDALNDAIKNNKDTEQIMKYIIELKRHEISINKQIKQVEQTKQVKPINELTEKERRARAAKRYKEDMARLGY